MDPNTIRSLTRRAEEGEVEALIPLAAEANRLLSENRPDAASDIVAALAKVIPVVTRGQRSEPDWEWTSEERSLQIFVLRRYLRRQVDWSETPLAQVKPVDLEDIRSVVVDEMVDDVEYAPILDYLWQTLVTRGVHAAEPVMRSPQRIVWHLCAISAGIDADSSYRRFLNDPDVRVGLDQVALEVARRIAVRRQQAGSTHPA
jgi:hypothetical protein